MDYRLAALHGWLDPEAMKAAMPQRAYIGWQLFWEAEPWGPWRDNLHAAILAREIVRASPKYRSSSRIDLKRFMYSDPGARAREGEAGFFGVMRTVADKVSPAEAAKRQQARKRKARGAGKRGK